MGRVCRNPVPLVEVSRTAGNFISCLHCGCRLGLQSKTTSPGKWRHNRRATGKYRGVARYGAAA